MAEWLRKIIALSLLLCGSGMAAWGQQVSGVDSAPIVNASSISADDTTVFGNERGMVQKMMKKNKDYWYRAMLRGRLDMKDEDVNYPKFVKFCVDTSTPFTRLSSTPKFRATSLRRFSSTYATRGSTRICNSFIMTTMQQKFRAGIYSPQALHP